MNRIRAVIGITMVAAVALIATVAQRQSARHIVRGGFWFDNVTFDLPVSSEELGGPITEPEQQAIEALAWSELRRAYSGYRITFVDNPDVRFSIRVIQRAPPRTGYYTFAVAESYSLGAFGGLGAVDFEVLASYAISNAPPGADRASIIEGIGRGIGRVAAHEFAHQLLTGVNIHASRDVASYEYARVDRAAQFYGPIHWDHARPFLLKRLGSLD